MLNNRNITIAIAFLCIAHFFSVYADVLYYEAGVQDKTIRVSATVLYAQEVPYVSLGELLRGLGGTIQVSPDQCQAIYRTTTAVLKPDNVAVAAPEISFSLIYPARLHTQDLYLAQSDIADFFARTYQIHITKTEDTTTAPAPESGQEPPLDEDPGSLLEVLPLPSPGTDTSVANTENTTDPNAAPALEPTMEEGAAEGESPTESASADTNLSAVDNIIILDSGHGGQDNGATVGDAVTEKDVALALVLKLRGLLKEMSSLTIHLTRDADKDLPLNARSKAADTVSADLLISIHAGYSAAASADGVTLFTDQLPSLPEANASAEIRQEYTTRRSRGEQAATIVYHIAHVLAEENSLGPVTVRTAPLSIQRLSAMPCILIELAYLNDPDIVASITEEEYQTRVAETLARAIIAALPQDSN